jgi:Holliday junction resolvase RusA-like endonuclease
MKPIEPGSRLAIDIFIETQRRLTGDLDNYAKSILDGIVKGGLIEDDSQIDQLRIGRNYGSLYREDCVRVEVMTL